MTGFGATLASLHPLVALGAKLAATFLLLPIVTATSAMVIGRTRDAELATTNAGARAAALGIAAGVAGLAIGVDVLDPQLVGAKVSSSSVWRGMASVGFALLASAPAWIEVRRNRPFGALDASARGALAVTLVVAMIPSIGIAEARRRSSLGDDPMAREVAEYAGLRAFLVPSDGGAHLALASSAAGSDEKSRARRELALARALGAAEADALEVESEMAARAGDCRAAVDLFHRALRERVPTDPTERMDLGGFHLPRSLVARCDLASGTSR